MAIPVMVPAMKGASIHQSTLSPGVMRYASGAPVGKISWANLESKILSIPQTANAFMMWVSMATMVSDKHQLLTS